MESVTLSKEDKVVGVVKHKITNDFILDLYEEAKKMRGKKKEEALERVTQLSKNIGCFLIKIENE